MIKGIYLRLKLMFTHFSLMKVQLYVALFVITFAMTANITNAALPPVEPELYVINSTQVTYNKKVIENADAASFQMINPVYAKDKNSVYFTDKQIIESDPLTFTILNNGYAKDKNAAYYQGLKITGVDISSFDAIGSRDDYAKDLSKVYHKGDAIDGSDPLTFEVLSTPFARDKNTGYYDAVKIAGSDGKSFEVVNTGGDYKSYSEYYSKDKSTVYFKTNTVLNADLGTFQMFYTGSYAKDKNAIYYDGVVIPGADLESFTMLSIYNLSSYELRSYVQDKNAVYFKGKKIEGSDPLTFIVLFDRFIWGSLDLYPYSKDKNNVYFEEKIVVGADIETFYVDGYGGKVYDKNYIYQDGKKVGTSTSPEPFKDIATYKYSKSINELYQSAIIDGYADNTYKPDNKINRAEFLKIVLSAKYTDQEIGRCKSTLPETWAYVYFNDVAKTEWYSDYICMAKTKNIIKGYPNGTFKPDQDVNLVEALKMLYIVFGEEGTVSAHLNWYTPYLSDATSKNILPEDLKSKLEYAITRGEMAEIIVRFMKEY